MQKIDLFLLNITQRLVWFMNDKAGVSHLKAAYWLRVASMIALFGGSLVLMFERIAIQKVFAVITMLGAAYYFRMQIDILNRLNPLTLSKECAETIGKGRLHSVKMLGGVAILFAPLLYGLLKIGDLAGVIMVCSFAVFAITDCFSFYVMSCNFSRKEQPAER